MQGRLKIVCTIRTDVVLLLSCLFPRFLIIIIFFHYFGPRRVRGISWVQPRNFKLLFFFCRFYGFLFLVSFRYVMYSVARLCCIPLVNWMVNEQFGLFVLIPRARDWFDLFVRFTPRFLKISWIYGLGCGQLWTVLGDCLYWRTLRIDSRSFVAWRYVLLLLLLS